jgi:MFS family permease
MTGVRLWPVAAAIFALMLPVTGVVPVLEELTGGRHPGLGDFAKHLFMVSNMLAALLCAPLAGRLSDHLGHRRPIIIAAMLVNAVVLSLLALDAPYAVHLLLRFFDGALHITALTLLMAMTADRAGLHASGQAMGLAGAALTLGVAVGAPVGGFVGAIDPLAVLLAGAALSLALAAWVGLLQESTHTRPAIRPDPNPAKPLPPAVLGELVVPYAFTFADRLSVGFIISTMTLYLRTVLGAGPTEIGLLMGSFMLPFALLTYTFGRSLRRLDPLPMMFAGSVIYGFVLVTLAFAPLPLWWFLMPTGGAAAALMFAPSLVLVAHAGGEHARATALGGFHAAGSLGFLLGPLVGGGVLAVAELVDRAGWTAAFLVVASLQWVCVALFLPRLRLARRRART